MPFLRRWKTFVFIVKKVSFISRTSLNLIFSPFLTENKFKTLHFFDQKQGLTPLEKCRFWDLKKFHFYSPKQFLFYLKLYWALFLVLFWPNLNTEKLGIFWPKAWFLRRWKILFLWTKKVSFSSRTSLKLISSPFFWPKKIKKEIEFFGQRHGLTPLEKCHFWDFEKLCFHSQKRFFLISQTSFSIISSLILTENKSAKKNWIFYQKHGKVQFLGLWKILSL